MKVSVIMPVFNEERYIRACLQSLVDNDFSQEELEILVYDGDSTDRTGQILREFADRYPFIRLCHNQERVQVKALNMALREARGQYIIRCDAHSEYPPGYISSLVSYLQSAPDDVGNVGGQAVTVPGSDSAIGVAVARALQHPVGVGLSHRSMQARRPVDVDTLLFGAWRREVFDKAGLFDEDFVRGQDLEHNVRLRRLGYRVVLLPDLKFTYRGRTGLGKLARMVHQYAYAKIQLIKKHRVFPNLRFLIPFLFLLSLPFLLFVEELRPTLYVYLAIVIGSSVLEAARARRPLLLPLLSVIFPVMHLSHGAGTLRALVEFFVLGRGKTRWEVTR